MICASGASAESCGMLPPTNLPCALPPLPVKTAKTITSSSGAASRSAVSLGEWRWAVGPAGRGRRILAPAAADFPSWPSVRLGRMQATFQGRPLFERTVNRGKRRIQGGAQTVHHRNDRKRNSRCDQTVFDCGCTGFVAEETSDLMLQLRLPWSFASLLSAWENDVARLKVE